MKKIVSTFLLLFAACGEKQQEGRHDFFHDKMGLNWKILFLSLQRSGVFPCGSILIYH